MKFWGLIFTRAICRRVFPGPNFTVKEHEQGPHRGLFRLPGDLTEAPNGMRFLKVLKQPT